MRGPVQTLGGCLAAAKDNSLHARATTAALRAELINLPAGLAHYARRLVP